MEIDAETDQKAAEIARQDRLYGKPEWETPRWAERSPEFQLAYRSAYWDG